MSIPAHRVTRCDLPSPSTVAVAVTKHYGRKDEEEESRKHGQLLGREDATKELGKAN